VKDSLDALTSDLATKIVERSRKGVAREGEAKGGGKVSSGSWLQAIAEAMGSIMGDKASDMVGLSKEMSNLSTAAKGIKADDTKGQQQNAKDFSIVQAKFQAASQEYSILSNTFSNAIKSIGEGLTSMGRKG
jgi:hypothetical protein